MRLTAVRLLTKQQFTEEEGVVGFSNGRVMSVVKDRGRDADNSPAARMPRGIKGACIEEQSLRIIDTAALRSGSGSRSDVVREDESMSELVASIASVGIIEPIVVRQIEGNDFVIVAGERRFAAARLLKLRQIPCVVTRCSDGESLVISLTENLQRSDLNPVDKAFALRRLLDEFALTQQEIGKRVGMSQSAIAHHLRLLALPEEVRRLISDGALSVGHGKVLAGIADENQAIDAALECVSKSLSVRDFEASLSAERQKSDKPAPRGSARNKRQEHELRNGLFLVIKEGRGERGSGTIEIPFYSVDEKNWVLKALSEQEARRKTPPAASRAVPMLRIPGQSPARYQSAHGTASS